MAWAYVLTKSKKDERAEVSVKTILELKNENEVELKNEVED
jgi:hypothetical protein